MKKETKEDRYQTYGNWSSAPCIPEKEVDLSYKITQQKCFSDA